MARPDLKFLKSITSQPGDFKIATGGKKKHMIDGLMALPVMEFPDQGYKIRNIFCKEINISKENFEF